MVPVGVSKAPVANPADGSFRHYDEAKIQPSSNRPVNSISKGWGCERSAGFSASITRRSLAGWYKLLKHSQQTHHRPKSAPSSKSMNSARSSLKKISMLALASGRLHLWQGPRLYLLEEDVQNGKDLHHTNRITQLPTEALFSQASS